jgi:dihydroxy-acid dehydratase
MHGRIAGLTLSGAAAIPAADSRKKVMAQLSGRRIVEMVKENLTIDKILTREAFENAIKVNAAVGGSSNFLNSFNGYCGRIGVDLKLEDFDTLGSNIPLLLNLCPQANT